MTAASAALGKLAAIGPYFTVGTGPVPGTGWRAARRLHTDDALLHAVVAGVGARIGTPHRRVAASTFQLGFAARLWSIGLGALAGHGLLIDLRPLLFRESAGQLQLHLEAPTAHHAAALHAPLESAVLDTHLVPLGVALHRVVPISDRLLSGNTVSALLGAARVFDTVTGGPTGSAWRVARDICRDERLAGAVRFESDTVYRRLSCCLFYRTPGGGMCGDCVLAAPTA